MSEVMSTKNKSQVVSILNNKGPSMDPYRTPQEISNSLLNEEPTLIFRDLSLRQS